MHLAMLMILLQSVMCSNILSPPEQLTNHVRVRLNIHQPQEQPSLLSNIVNKVSNLNPETPALNHIKVNIRIHQNPGAELPTLNAQDVPKGQVLLQSQTKIQIGINKPNLDVAVNKLTPAPSRHVGFINLGHLVPPNIPVIKPAKKTTNATLLTTVPSTTFNTTPKNNEPSYYDIDVRGGDD